MATYTKSTDFAAKDALVTGNPAKLIKGTEIGSEFDAIQTADADNMKKSAMGTGVETFLTTPSSENLAAAVTGETGSGALVFGTAPQITNGDFNTPDIDGGTIDGATIATSDITVGAGKTLDVSAGTLTLANDQISGDKVEGGTINAVTINTLTSGTVNATTVNATTFDMTNLEVTNIKAKDGTASATIADSTGVMTVSSAVLTTADINGGTIDGAVIGGSSAAAGTFTTLASTGNATLGDTSADAHTLNGTMTVATAGKILLDDSVTAAGAALPLAFDGDADTGLFRPAANTLAIATGATERMRIDSAGNVGIGGAATVGRTFEVTKSVTGAVVGIGIRSAGQIQSDVTTEYRGFASSSSSAASNFNIGSIAHYHATQGTLGNVSSGGTVTSQFGFYAESTITGATNNFGFYSNIASGTGRWNFYAAGTAANYFGGNVGVVGTLGYTTGAGGTVTQATSRTTGVTINKTSGAITLVSAAGSTSWQTFTVTNSTVAATDTIIVNQKSGTDLNMIHVTAVAAGSFNISFATTGGTTTEQPVFNFNVIKGVTS